MEENQDNIQDNPQNTRERLTIRITQQSLSFSITDPNSELQVRYEPYTVRSGISMAANLREAFRTEDILQQKTARAQVLIDTPVVLIPIEEWQEDEKEALYRHTIRQTGSSPVLSHIIPGLNVVALFTVNKDLKTVVEDHFTDVRFLPLALPVWEHFHRCSFTGSFRKLFAYFHEQKLEIFSFDKNRFRFCNCFETRRAKDAVYFLLFVWKQLGMSASTDEMHLAGVIPEKEELQNTLRDFIAKPYIVNPSAEYNRAPVTRIKGIPYDLVTLYLKR